MRVLGILNFIAWLKTDMDRGAWHSKSMGLQRVGHNWETERARVRTHTHTHTHTHNAWLMEIDRIYNCMMSSFSGFLCLYLSVPAFSHHTFYYWLHRYYQKVWASLVAQTVKCLPAMRETGVRFLGREDPLEKKMAIHSSVLAWKIPWMEEPGRLQSMGSQRVGHDWATSLSLHFIRITDW